MRKTEEIRALIAEALAKESDAIANMGVVTAILRAELDLIWVGFYRFENGVLVLGPFQGGIVDTRIQLGTGVCGTCAAKLETTNVPDVTAFPGYLEGNAAAKSELTVPIMIGERLWGILDADSVEPAFFNPDLVSLFEAVAQDFAETLVNE